MCPRYLIATLSIDWGAYPAQRIGNRRCRDHTENDKVAQIVCPVKWRPRNEEHRQKLDKKVDSREDKKSWCNPSTKE